MENKQFIELKKTDYGEGYSDGYKAGSNYRELGCEDYEANKVPNINYSPERISWVTVKDRSDNNG